MTLIKISIFQIVFQKSLFKDSSITFSGLPHPCEIHMTKLMKYAQKVTKKNLKK